MSRNRIFILLSTLLVLSMLVVACGAEETTAPVQPTTAPAVEPTTAPAVQPTTAPAVEPTTAPAVEPTAEPVAPALPYRIAVLSDMTTRNIWAIYDPDASTWNYLPQAGYWPALFTYSDQRFDYIPSIAEDFASPLEQEGDFWVSTVKIKPGVMWNNGEELTAEDFAFTANAAVEFNLSGNWEAYDDNYLDHVEAVDSYTAKIYYHTKPGLSRHEFGVLQGPIINAKFWDPKLGDARAKLAELEGLDPEGEDYAAILGEAQQMLYALDPEGEPTYGMFQFKKWEVGAFVENEVNPDHYFANSMVEEYTNGAYREYKEGVYDFTAYGDPSGDKVLEFENGPHFAGVIYSLYDQNAAILALQNGDVDYAMNPSGWGTGLQAQLGGDPNISTVTNPQNGFRFMTMNFLRPPMDDVAFRQAVNCMIDKQFLSQQLLQGQVLPAYTPVPEANGFWYNPEVTRFCEGFTDQERMEWAVNRLKEAGYTWDIEPAWNEERGGSVDWGEGIKYPDGTYVQQLELLAPSPGYDPLRATSGVYIEQWISQLGFPVKAELTNFNNILTAWFDTGDWDMFLMGWGLSLYPDYVCDFFYTGAGFNAPNYSNPDFDAMCDEFYAADNLEDARALNFELQDILANDLPYIYLFANPIVDAWRNDTVSYPYTEVLDGIQGLYGMQTIVNTAE